MNVSPNLNLVALPVPEIIAMGLGGWPLGYEERTCWANCPCN